MTKKRNGQFCRLQTVSHLPYGEWQRYGFQSRVMMYTQQSKQGEKDKAHGNNHAISGTRNHCISAH
jgi:hypothetical protein